MSDKISYKAFSASIKAKYPEYSEVDDLELSTKMIEKYPEYADRVTLTDNSDFMPGGKMSLVPPSPSTPSAPLRDQTNFLSSKTGDNASASLSNQSPITKGDKMRLGSFPVQAPTLNLEDKPTGQFYKPLPRQTSLYNPRLRENDMTGLTEEKTADTRPALQKEFIAPTGESIKQGYGAQEAATSQSAEYLANPQEQAQAQWELLNSTPQKYGTPRKDQFGNESWDLTADDQEYMNSLFDQLPERQQVEEWKKNPEKWNDRPFIQQFRTVADSQKSIFGDNWLGDASLAAGNVVEALNAGGAAVGGGLSEFVHQNIEKPLFGWVSKDPSSRLAFGRLADVFFEDQAYSSSAAGKHNTIDENGNIRQKDFTDYIKEGDFASALGDLSIGALESAPTSAVAIGATMAGSPQVGLGLIGAQVAGSRKRELDRNNPELSEFQKNLIAYGSGAIEAGSELLGDIPIGKMLGKIYKVGGTTVAENVMKNSVESIIETTTKQLKNGSILWKAPLSEGGEEFASGIGNYLLDSAMGIQNFNFNEMMNQSAKQMAYGAVAGGGFGLVGTPGLIRNAKVAKELETLKSQYDTANSNMQNAFADSEFEFEGEKIITLPLAQQQQILPAVYEAENLSDAQKTAIRDYMEAGNNLNAALVNVGLTNIELLRKKANAFKEVQESINDKTGKVDVITIQGTADTQQYNVKSGTVALDNEGKVDTQNSDEAIYYYTGAMNEDGTPEVSIITPESISELTQLDPKEELKSRFTEIEAEEFVRSEFGAGMQIQVNSDAGLLPATVVAVTPTGLVANVQGQEVELSFAQAVEDVEAVESQAQAQTPTGEQQTTYAPGTSVVVNGTTFVVGEQDEAGNYMINDEAGQPLDRFTPEEMAEFGFEPIREGSIISVTDNVDGGDIVDNASTPSALLRDQDSTRAASAYPLLKDGTPDFDNMTVAQTYEYMVDNYGQEEANNGLSMQEKSIQALISQNIKALSKVNEQLYGQLRTAKTIQEQLKIREKNKATITKLTDERTALDTQLAEIRALMPVVQQTPAQPEVMAVKGSNVRPEEQLRREQEAKKVESEKVESEKAANKPLSEIKNIKISDINNVNENGQNLEDALINVQDGLESKTEGPILVTKVGNKYNIADGFHRLAKAILNGDSIIEAEVLNITNTKGEQETAPVAEVEEQPVIEVREKEEWKGTPQWTRRLINLGDAMTVEDVVLRRIAGGAKFVWTASAPLKGLAEELGFTNKPGERKLRKNLIDNENGMTPQEFAHVIYESGDLDFMPGVEYQDVYNAVVETLLQVNSATMAMEKAEANRNKYDMMQEDYDIYRSIIPEEWAYLEEIPDEILAGYLGITNFSPEQIDFIFNIQNEYYANEQQQTPANAEPADTSTSERSEGIESKTSARTSEITTPLEDIYSRISIKSFKDYLINDGLTKSDINDIISDKDEYWIERYLDDEFGITINQNGYVQFNELNKDVKKLIGNNKVLLYHHTSDAILPKIAKEGLKSTELDVNRNGDANLGVYVTSEYSGKAVEGYKNNASRVHGGNPITLEVSTTINQLKQDQNDSDIKSGKYQFVLDNVKPQDIVNLNDIYNELTQSKLDTQPADTSTSERSEAPESTTSSGTDKIEPTAEILAISEKLVNKQPLTTEEQSVYKNADNKRMFNEAVGRIIAAKDEEDEKKQQAKKKAKKSKPKTTTPQSQIQQVLDNYNDEGQNGNGTMQEVIENIVTVAYDNDITAIQEAYKTYQDELREDREEFGERGDREAIENNFMQVVNDYLNQSEQPLEKLTQAELDTQELDAYIAGQAHNSNPTEKQKETGIYDKARISLQGHNITLETLKNEQRSGVDSNGKAWSITMNNHYGELDGTTGYDGDAIDVFVGPNPKGGQIFVIDQVTPINKERQQIKKEKELNPFIESLNGTGIINTHPTERSLINLGQGFTTIVDQVNVTDAEWKEIRTKHKELEAGIISRKEFSEWQRDISKRIVERTINEIEEKYSKPIYEFDESKVMLGFDSAEEARAAYMSNYEAGWQGFGNITPAGDNFKAWLYDGKKQRKPFAEYKETPEAVEVSDQSVDANEMIEKPAEATLTPKYKNGDTVYYQGKQYVINGIYNGVLAYDLETADGKLAFEEVEESKLSNHAPAPRSILDVAVEQVKKNEQKAAQQPKEVDVAGVFNSLNKKGTAKLSENIVPDKVSAAQAEQPISVDEQEIVDTDSKIQNVKAQPKVTATDEKIRDVGQKIGGAKKDLFNEYAKKLLSVTDQDIASLPLSKSFPRPNFAQLIEEGKMTQETAIFLNYFYDNIPTKPQKKYKVERWVLTVREALNTFNSVLENKPIRDLMQEYIDMLNTNIVGQRKAFNAEVYRAVRKAINFPNNDVNVGNLTILRQQTSEGKYVYSVGSPVGNRVRLAGRFETMQQAAAKLIEMAKETAGKPKQVEFSVYSSRSSGDFYITPKGKGEIVLQNGFKTSKEAFEYINENRDALTDRFNAMKEIPSERRMSNSERVGFDYRQGKSVTAEDFGREFGFRGVEFGNWVNQEERQAHINEAYDALMDLASVIGVTPRALSLNGELGFAFGSRGGGKYAAHYEPDKVVINLTKTKGAGTLAHEWFHALDNYLLRTVGNKTSYATEGPGFNKEGKPALRPELNDAFRNLMKVIRKSGFYTRSAKLDKIKGSKYWGTSIELGARGFEDFVMNKLAKSNIQNDYLVNFKSLAEFIDRVNGDISEITSKYPYPTMEESEAINEAYQNLFDTIQEDDNAVLFQAISPIGFYSTVEKALEAIQQEKGSKDQFKAMLLKNGAKQAEMDWMGFDELPEKLTKADIQNWIDENRIEVEEVEKIDREKATDKDANKYSKYHRFVLPGGENYKELLLTMPVKETFDTYRVKLQEKYGELSTRNDYSKEENEKLDYLFKNNSDKFRSSHFDEPNILAHIRFNERTVNGERVLFIEEFQSDWAQKGKKEGFSDPRLIQRKNEIQAEMETLRQELDVLRDRDAAENNNGTRREANLLEWAGKYEPEKDSQMATLLSELNSIEEGSVPDMPFRKTDQWVNLAARRMMRYAAENGFDRIAWTNGEQQADRYDLSKSIKEIEYSINPFVLSQKDNLPMYNLKARDKNDNPVIKGEYAENELENIVGKELAKKIINGEGKETVDKTKSLTGLDLKVGGEGMKAFYDAIVPSAMSKLGKPFGAKLENIDIKTLNTENTRVEKTEQGNYKLVDEKNNILSSMTGETGDGYSKEDLHNELIYLAKRYPTMNGITSVQSIPVTDSMKETAMAGLPLYHTGTTMQRTSKKEVSAMVEQLLKTGLAKEVRMVTPEEIAGILEGNEQMQVVNLFGRDKTQQKIDYLRGIDIVKTDETRTDEDYDPDDAEYTQQKVYIPVYLSLWEYADNTNPDTEEFSDIDEALMDLQTPGDYSYIDSYFTPSKTIRLELKEAWIDKNGDIIEESDNLLNVDDTDDLPVEFKNKLSEYTNTYDSFGTIDTNTFEGREDSARELENKVYFDINKDIISEYDGYKVSSTNSGKYRNIYVEKGEESDVIQLRIADHSYNPNNNDLDARQGKFISIEIANVNPTEGRFHGSYGIQFDGSDTYEDVVEEVNDRIKEIIDNIISVQFFRTPTGTIYGFVKGGVVYLNSTTPNLNTPIHEFGHLWIDAIEGSELYNRGAELVKNTPYWERVNTDPNYKDLSETARIKEAMAMAIGDKGEAVKRNLGLFASIKVWIADVWTRIGAKFGIQNLTPEQIQNLTFNDFVDVAVSELLTPSPSGIPLKKGKAGAMPATIDVDGVQRPTTNSTGKPIHSTEEGIRNFWRWFGNSKVTDKQGRPLVVYHGTRKGEFNAFNPSEGNPTLNGGMYFSDSNEFAKKFAGPNGDIYEVYLKIDNPLYDGFDGSGVGAAMQPSEYRDGGIFTKRQSDKYADVGTKEYVVFSPTQIKSATGNNGGFDGSDPDIRYQVIGERGAEALDAAEEATTRLDNLAVAKEMEGGKRNALRVDENGRNIVWENDDYMISVNDPENATYIVLWNNGKKVGELFTTKGRNSATNGYLSVQNIEIDKKHRGKGLSSKMYDALLNHLGEKYKGISSENEQRVNKKQVPQIWKRLNATELDGNYTVDKKQFTPQEIRLATGWERGVDGLWRYEVPDIEIKKEVLKELEKNQYLSNQEVNIGLVNYRKEPNGLYTLVMFKKGATSTNENVEYKNLSEAELIGIIDNKEVSDKILAGEGRESFIGENWDESKEIKTDFTTFITGGLPLNDVIKDNGLFKAYPALKDIIVVVNKRQGHGAAYITKDDGQKVIEIGFVWNKTHSSIIHEIQHAIQEIEGFAKGGNINTDTDTNAFENYNFNSREAKAIIKAKEDFNNSELGKQIQETQQKDTEKWIKLMSERNLSNEEWKAIANAERNFKTQNGISPKEYIDKYPTFNNYASEQYTRLSGEVEARNASARMSMSEKERRQTLLSATADVAPEDQIVLMENIGVSMSEPEKPEFTGNLGEYAQQIVEYNEQAAERTTRISKMQRLQEIMVAKSALAARHRNKEISNQEYAKQMLALHEEKQRVMKGLPTSTSSVTDASTSSVTDASTSSVTDASTSSTTEIDDPKPVRAIGQSIAEWATQVADWNYRQTIAKALAKTASSITGGLPPVDDDTDISGDMIRAELDQRLGGFFGRLVEGWQDNIRSVRIFLDLLREKGTKVSDFNNFYMQYTAIQGKNDAHLKDFGKRFMEAINANVLNIQKYTNYEYRDLENYVFLKHGIERNEYMRQAAAEEAVNEKLPKLTQEQIDGDIDGSLQDEYKAAYEQFLEEETAKVADKDYSGLFAVAAEIWAKQNGEAFNPKKKGDVARIQKMDEFKADRDAVIVEYIAKFEKTISETIIPTAVKGEQLTINGFWAAINAATHYSLDRLVTSGIESKEEVDDLKARYQYYVPLRGHEVEAEKIWQYEAPDNKNVVSKAIMQASGRGSRAEHPFAYIIQMAQTSINKANRNQLNQTILRLARLDKSGLMSVSETWYVLTGTDPDSGKEIWTETEPDFSEDHEIRAGEIRAWNEKMKKLEEEGKARRFKKGLRIGGLFIKPKQKRQHAITIFEDGESYQVYINGNPRVSQAINELNEKRTEIPIIPQLTRFCASMMTSRSPQFMLTNGARDLVFASSILPSKEGARYTGQFLKNYPVAMAILANNATFDFGNDKARYKKYLKEFEMNGGETGYTHLLELQDIQKELHKKQKGKNYLNPKTDIDVIISVVDAGNKVIENSTRLAVYIASRENGRSIERSVSDSKEVTLNFNRRGSGVMGASFVKSFFMFVNAGVQALANFGHVYKMHPAKMSATIGTYAAVGFILPMIINMIGGDDDEKEYMNMTDWERQNNLCLPTGNGVAKIPLPQEMRVFFKLGDEVYKLYSGRTEASETAMATLLSAVDLIPISPLGTIAAGEINDFGDLQRAISPDALRSVAEIATNANFMGGQIYDKYKAEKDNMPGYQKARLNRVGDPRAPESIVGFTKWLDHLTGGNGVEKGRISWNPDIVNHIAKSYLNGVYGLISEGGKSFTKRFYTSNADIEEKNTTVKDYYKRIREAEEVLRQDKGYWEQVEKGEISEDTYNKAIPPALLEKAYTIHDYGNTITKIERLLKTGDLTPDDELYYKHMSDSLKMEVIRIR